MQGHLLVDRGHIVQRRVVLVFSEMFHVEHGSTGCFGANFPFLSHVSAR
jgi:hypothetical protein